MMVAREALAEWSPARPGRRLPWVLAAATVLAGALLLARVGPPAVREAGARLLPSFLRPDRSAVPSPAAAATTRRP
jgi:hypothetical protein